MSYIHMNKVLYTGGTFDIFHSGHVNFLKMCSRLADEVVVCLNTDEFINTFKGAMPVISYEDRKTCLESCKYVDRVIKNTGDQDSKSCILSINPNILAIGSDWCSKNYYQQMGFTQDWLDDNGIVLVYLPYTQGISSSKIKQDIFQKST